MTRKVVRACQPRPGEDELAGKRAPAPQPRLGGRRVWQTRPTFRVFSRRCVARSTAHLMNSGSAPQGATRFRLRSRDSAIARVFILDLLSTR
jgi:hypothetical protein